MRLPQLKKHILLSVCLGFIGLIFAQNICAQTSRCRSLYPISTETISFDEYGNKEWHYKWGYIDCTGHMAIKPENQKAFDFNEGIGVLVNGQDSVLIGIKGKRKLLPRTRILTPYSEGVAIAEKQGTYS
jgi:hypothetical protein